MEQVVDWKPRITDLSHELEGGAVRIHLLHTNDVHSNLENFMRLGASLQRHRQEIRDAGEAVFTFDIGDLLDRVRPETEATLGDINSALLGALKYDGWVFGNNEGMTIPVDKWPALAKQSGTTVFGSNIRQLDGKAFPGFQDWCIYPVNQIRVGVFGLTANYTLPYHVLGADVDNPVVRAAQMVRELQAAGADIIVLLSHLGLHEDRALAAEVSGIDVILGGHTHQFMQSAEWVNNTAVFQPGKHALVYGHTVIDYDESAEFVHEVTSRPVRIDLHGPFDSDMITVYQSFEPVVSETLAEHVADLDTRLELRLDEESPFANAFIDTLYDEYPCDLGLVNAGMLTASLLPGSVERQHVLGACSTPTRPVSMTLSGQDIALILKQAVQPSTYLAPAYGFGFRGSVIGFMALANATVALQDGEGETRVESIEIGGQPLVQEWDYRVVTCEYLWLGPVFEVFRRGRDVTYHPPLAREILMKGLGTQGALLRAHQSRYVHRGTSRNHFRQSTNTPDKD